MNRGMNSSYISVREKNMKLLLSAVTTYPRLLLHYHRVIAHGLVDRGVSVRRVSAQLMEQLMKRLADETPEGNERVASQETKASETAGGVETKAVETPTTTETTTTTTNTTTTTTNTTTTTETPTDKLEGKERLLLSSLQLALQCLLKEGDSAVRTALLNGVVAVLCDCPRTSGGFARLAVASRVVVAELDGAEDAALAEALRGQLERGRRKQVASLVQWLCDARLSEEATLVGVWRGREA